MRSIEKKIWLDMFECDRQLPIDFRLADFELEVNDEIIFREWDPKTQEYTGRQYVKKVGRVTKCESPTRYWSQEQMEKHGMYLIE